MTEWKRLSDLSLQSSPPVAFHPALCDLVGENGDPAKGPITPSAKVRPAARSIRFSATERDLLSKAAIAVSLSWDVTFRLSRKGAEVASVGYKSGGFGGRRAEDEFEIRFIGAEMKLLDLCTGATVGTYGTIDELVEAMLGTALQDNRPFVTETKRAAH